MTKKVGRGELKKLVESAMNEIDLSVYTDSSTGLLKTKLTDTDISSGADTGLVGVSADDLEGFAKTKPEENQLDDNDIQYFIDNPDQIDTKTQSILIAIARTGSERWLQGRVDKAQEIYNQKQQELNTHASVEKKLEDLYSALENKKSSLDTPSVSQIFSPTRAAGHTDNRNAIIAALKDPNSTIKMTPSGQIKIGNTTYKPAKAKKDNDFKFAEGGEKMLRDFLPRRSAYYDAKKALENEKKKSKSKEYFKAKRALGNAEQFLKNANARLDKFNENKEELEKLSKMASQALDNLDAKIADAAGRDQSISDPIMKTAGGDAGKFTSDQEAIVKRVLSEQTGIVARMTEINRISEKYYNAATKDENPLSGDALSKVLSEIMLLDLFNTMSKEFDSGAGAYLFESFLALMMGGSVTGKDKTTAGRMGAVDFVTDEGETGSAKYYQNANAAEQALSGFIDMYNQKYPNPDDRTDTEGNPKRIEVRYVIAAKKQDVGQMGSPTRGTSDPSKIIGAEIYTPLVSFYIKNNKVFAQIKRGNEYSEDLKISGEGQIKIGAGLTEADSLGMLYITTARTSTFKEMINTSMEKQEEDAKNAFKEFQNYFEELRTASESAKKYIAGGDVSDGNRTYESLEKAETSFSVVVTNLEYGNKVSTDPSTGATSIVESKKITAKHLQKLISEKFKK